MNTKGSFLLNGVPVLSAQLSTAMAEAMDRTKATKNVINIKTEREVSYNDFIGALDASKKAIHIFYNKIAVDEYSKEYNMLSNKEQLMVRAYHPVAMAENVEEC